MLVAVATTKNAVEKYDNLPDSAKSVPLSERQLPPEIKTRCIASLMILKNALKLGGVNAQLNFIQTPNVRREEDELIKGNAIVSSHLFNLSSIEHLKYKDKIYVSDPVIKDGEFEKGIFCLPGNHKVLNVRTVEDLKKAGKPLIGIHWSNECQTLKDLGIKEIEKGPTMDCLFRMIKAGRADWIPLGFHNSKDLSVTRNGITLVPVEGIKFSLTESRHFIVSKQHPDGEKIFEALQMGIKQMRQNGLIKKLLTQGGFYCKATKDWKILNSKSFLMTNK
ncbi:conserved hypothetical protein [Maridesulfovibrio salexigens DSM 2638]|uniref:ABC-type amino acid transport substrate-binding protein n=2 Tax=Maridesulfovibrio salexigens TaxID=880 RepID=C6BTQ3_MARSD|nr:conserved hypothetical protein [Maridesulfovibrio salexigens DSM 2638]